MRQKAQRMALVLRLALRDFRGGLQGLAVFLLSIALGVLAVTSVGSVSTSLTEGLARRGQAILGGDISFDLAQREASPRERAYFAELGRVSALASMRAMARRLDGETALVEIKAVDEAYPLSDGPVLDPPLPLADALTERGGVFGLAADPVLLARLRIGVGSTLMIGEARFEVRAALAFEPDRLSSGVRFGQPVLMSQEALRATGLLGPGSLVKWRYRVLLAGEPANSPRLAALAAAAQELFPSSGFEIRTREHVSPQFAKNLDRFTDFLALVALTSLIVGGVGVANAMRGFVARKRSAIAIMKSLGASGSMIFSVMLTQAMLVAGAGAALGAAGGAALPYLLAPALGAMLPFPVEPSIDPAAITKGLLFGFLTALAFSAAPLGRAHDVPAQALFRAAIEPGRHWPRPRYLALTLVAVASMLLAVLGLTADRRLALLYLTAMLASFVLLRAAAALVIYGAQRAPHPPAVALKLAMSNLRRPGALTVPAMVSLGLALALLAALGETASTLTEGLAQTAPGETPSFFFLDVPQAKSHAFVEFLHAQAPGATIELVPMLRGRIVRLKGVAAGLVHPRPDTAWVLDGDRGISFAQSIPAGSRLAAGTWWPEGYRGPPLVSIEADAAQGLGLSIGDEVAVNVLGREVTARIASTREVNWRSFGINFVMVFSPNSFTGAPFDDLATLAFADGGDPQREARLMRETARAFPTVTSIRVKDALDAVSQLAGELAFAIRCVASVAIVASILVLAGALAAGQEIRAHDAVILKTLGATRARLLLAYAYEYGIIGLCAVLFGMLAGSLAAFAIVRTILKLGFIWHWQETGLAAAAGVLMTIALGLAGSWRILGRKAAPYLREL